MLSRIREFIKGVLRRMFNRDVYAKITSTEDVAISNQMMVAIDNWKNMLLGKAKWVVDEEIESSGLETAIVKEFANIALSETETRIEGNDELNEIYQKAIETLNENLQLFLALGSGVIKPLGNGGDVEFIEADKIIPLDFDANGRLTQACFIQTKEAGEAVVYYRTEIHTLKDGKLNIRNKAFKGNKNILGDEIPLDTIEEWKDLEEDVTYEVETIDFGYYRNPLPNLVDGSKVGVSVYSGHENQIRKCDIQNARLDWEYESAERAVFADYTAVKKTGSNNGGFSFEAPKGKDRLFVGVDMDDRLETFNPAIRDANFIAGKNEYLRELEFSVGLAYGDLSKNEVVNKTATEVKTSKKRKYDMVTAIQNNLKMCLEDLAKALAFYNEMYTTNYTVICNFHDSILTDEETERQQDRADVASGFMSRLEYRMKWYNEDKETALKNLPQIETGIID